MTFYYYFIDVRIIMTHQTPTVNSSPTEADTTYTTTSCYIIPVSYLKISEANHTGRVETNY